ncbi:MAG: gliding motility protein GldM [Bacteroidales bacterium]|jgi:gliding motility-associated protein GldM|nr:gliding motility protein GldM [Bacteroidales bacterium]
MGHGKETPRQKMIGLMYLFLTCMLALNVSKDILDAFIQINNSLNETNQNFVSKNQMLYASIEKSYLATPGKVQRVKNASDSLRTKADFLVGRFQHFKDTIVIYADKIPQSELIVINGRNYIKQEETGDTVAIETVVNNKDNTDIPAQIMVGPEQDGSKGQARFLKEDVDNFREWAIATAKQFGADSNSVIVKNIKSALNTEPEHVHGETGAAHTWMSRYFEHLPLIAVVANLTQMQSLVRNIEGDLLNLMYGSIDAASFKFNKVIPMILPRETYIMQGNEYVANIFLAAFDTTTPTRVMVGDRELPIDPATGLPILRITGNAVGPQTFNAVIKIKDPVTEKDVAYPITGQFQVAKAGLVVSPTKMNVFYIGPENPVAISVPGVPADRISAFLTPANMGSITKAAGGGYIVKVNTPGKCYIAVTADFNGTKKNMGQEEFRIKRVPDPVASVLGMNGGPVDKAKLQAATTVDAQMKDFDFDLKFTVQSFQMAAKLGAYFVEESAPTNRITANMKQNILQKVQKGSKVYFENIKATGPDGAPRQLGVLLFTIN